VLRQPRRLPADVTSRHLDSLAYHIDRLLDEIDFPLGDITRHNIRAVIGPFVADAYAHAMNDDVDSRGLPFPSLDDPSDGFDFPPPIR
jgi:hypothetical protein